MGPVSARGRRGGVVVRSIEEVRSSLQPLLEQVAIIPPCLKNTFPVLFKSIRNAFWSSSQFAVRFADCPNGGASSWDEAFEVSSELLFALDEGRRGMIFT